MQPTYLVGPPVHPYPPPFQPYRRMMIDLFSEFPDSIGKVQGVREIVKVKTSHQLLLRRGLVYMPVIQLLKELSQFLLFKSITLAW